jgi:hypothetical protein
MRKKKRKEKKGKGRTPGNENRSKKSLIELEKKSTLTPYLSSLTFLLQHHISIHDAASYHFKN